MFQHKIESIEQEAGRDQNGLEKTVLIVRGDRVLQKLRGAQDAMDRISQLVAEA